MNVYYYAPKDDPYHRKLWQEPGATTAALQAAFLTAEGDLEGRAPAPVVAGGRP